MRERTKILELNGAKVVCNRNGVICKEDNTSFNRICDSLEINGSLYSIKQLMVKAFLNKDVEPERIRVMNPKASDKFSITNLRIMNNVPIKPVTEIPKSTEYCELWDITNGFQVLWETGLTFSVNNAAIYIAEQMGYNTEDNYKISVIISNIRNCMRGDTNIIYKRFVCLNVVTIDQSEKEKEYYSMQIESRKRFYNNDIFCYGNRLVFRGSDIRLCCKTILANKKLQGTDNYIFAAKILKEFYDQEYPQNWLNEDSMYRIHCYNKKGKITTKIYFDSHRNRQLEDYSHHSSCSIDKKEDKPVPIITSEEKVTKEEINKGFRLKIGNKYITLVPTICDKDTATIFNQDSLGEDFIKELIEEVKCTKEWVD